MIVIGYSADQYGQAALEHGIAEAQLRKTTLLVTNSTTGEALADPRFAQSREIHDAEEQLTRCGVNFELAQTVSVDTAENLLAATDRPDAELLVIGMRHRNPVGKLLLGSISQRVILECAKPVLAVKPDDD